MSTVGIRSRCPGHHQCQFAHLFLTYDVMRMQSGGREGQETVHQKAAMTKRIRVFCVEELTVGRCLQLCCLGKSAGYVYAIKHRTCKQAAIA